jgi:hypothetical protein
MKKQNSITPPVELIEQWAIESPIQYDDEEWAYEFFIAHHAAQWGADQELEACCEWIPKATPWDAEKLRAARRPKPPSLKRVALLRLDTLNADLGLEGKGVDLSQIRLALEQLDD